MMTKWKKEEVRVWRLKRRVVAEYPEDKWATWINEGVEGVGECIILGAKPYDWGIYLADDVGKTHFIDIEACRNGEMDEHLDPEFGPKPRMLDDYRLCHACRYIKTPIDESPCEGCYGAENKPNWVLRNKMEDKSAALFSSNAALDTHRAKESSAAVDSKIAYGSKKSEPFRCALTEVWRVSLHGQVKHGANNWQSAEANGMHFYEDALWRHLQDRRMGEVKALDSGCYHLAHLAWNALMLLEMELRGVTNPEWGVVADDD